MRHVAGASPVGLAAVLVLRYGDPGQLLAYLMIAGALVPQILVNLLALHNDERRSLLRSSTRPAWLLSVITVVLLAASCTTLLAGQPVVQSLAGLCAAAGLAIAAAPASIVIVPRSRRRSELITPAV